MAETRNEPAFESTVGLGPDQRQRNRQPSLAKSNSEEQNGLSATTARRERVANAAQFEMTPHRIALLPEGGAATRQAAGSARGRGGRRVIVLTTIQAVITAGGALLLVTPASAPGSYALSAGLLTLLGWCIVSWRLAGRPLFDPYMLFMLSAFLFNAGQATLEVFGLNIRGILNGAFSEATVNATLVLVFVALSALHAGALLGVLLWYRPHSVPDRGADGSWFRGIGWTLLLVSLPPTVVSLSQSLGLASAAGYQSLYDRDFETGLAASPQLLGGLFVPAILFLTVAGRTRRFERLLAATLTFSFVAVEMFVGLRSTAVMPLVAWSWLRHRTVKKINAPALVIAAAAMVMVVFPAIREVRGLSISERSLAVIGNWFDLRDNPAVSSISEMGASAATIAHTLTLVPSSKPFDDGEGYAYAILTVLPNLFWETHPTVTRGTNSRWLVWTVDPLGASRGGGLGFSFIAEAYLNFGPFGPLAMMFVFGMLLVRLVSWADLKAEPGRLALVAVVLAFILRFPRDELSSIVRPIVWYGVVPYLVAVLTPRIVRSAVKSRPVRLVQRTDMTQL